MKNKKELYAEMPQVLKAYHIRRGKLLGKTGEEYFVDRETAKDKEIMSMYETKTEKEMQDHLCDVSLALDKVAQYLELIDSPFAKEAHELEGAMMRFQANFSTKEDCETWNDTYGKENPSEPKAEPVSFHTTIQHNATHK